MGDKYCVTVWCGAEYLHSLQISPYNLHISQKEKGNKLQWKTLIKTSYESHYLISAAVRQIDITCFHAEKYTDRQHHSCGILTKIA